MFIIIFSKNKILFQELAENMGVLKLNEKLIDPDLKEYFTGIFPKDHPQNSRFSINFFYSIGLNPLTQDLRQFLFEEVDKNKEEILAIEGNDQLESPGIKEPVSEDSSEESESEEMQMEVESKEKKKETSEELNLTKPQDTVKQEEKKESSAQKLDEERAEVQDLIPEDDKPANEEGLELVKSSNKDLLRHRSKDKKKKHKKKKSKLKKKISKKERKSKKKKSRKRRKMSNESLQMFANSSLSSLSDS